MAEHPDGHLDLTAVLSEASGVEPNHFAMRDVLKHLRELFALFERQQHGDVMADRLPRRITQQTLGRGVPASNGAIASDRKDGVWRRTDNRLVNEAQLLAGKVRHHQTMQSFSIDCQTRRRNKRMHNFAACGSKLNFITTASCPGQKLGCPRISGSLGEMFGDKAADYPLARSLQHASKGGVAVKNDALCRKRESAFRHLLYQLTIGVRRAFERIYQREPRRRLRQSRRPRRRELHAAFLQPRLNARGGSRARPMSSSPHPTTLTPL